MPRFEMLTHVAASPERVFEASLSVDVHTASFGRSGERAVSGVTSGLLTLGDQVTWEARHFGLRWRLTSLISACEAPSFFVDEQTAGPFRRFRHEHRFAADGDGTLMRDVVEFASPLGVLGAVADAVVLRRYLARLISVRNEHLKAFTEAGTS
ncbi:SRPBCC family protein [Nonomuraea cavernae]|uniref:Cyclase n=1 Tax=Nonomuraea cavernae TaxID=2045107 RepID=A0A917YP90_9ACTN|nr:SRPBCC family protein [Nonomuraea cavernae]MCA2184772.1 SRPBCC family protein [Nonomuraea cavernae]GGO62795.1 hypothetical protein GCM10012289_08190 [Nonomuraea cavernae]